MHLGILYYQRSLKRQCLNTCLKQFQQKGEAQQASSQISSFFCENCRKNSLILIQEVDREQQMWDISTLDIKIVAACLNYELSVCYKHVFVNIFLAAPPKHFCSGGGSQNRTEPRPRTCGKVFGTTTTRYLVSGRRQNWKMPKTCDGKHKKGKVQEVLKIFHVNNSGKYIKQIHRYLSPKLHPKLSLENTVKFPVF